MVLYFRSRHFLSESRRTHDRRFRLVFDHTALGMAIVDLEGCWTAVNGPLCRMLGRTEEELLGTSFLAVTPPEDHANEEGWQGVFETQPDMAFSLEKRYLRADGSTFWAEVTASLMPDAQGRPENLICVIADITRRLAAESEAAHRQEELAHVSRIHTLQQMTSELAHEMDQPLCAIQTAAQAALRLQGKEASRDPRLAEALGMVVGQAERAGEVVRRIKDFSRKKEPEFRPVDLFTILEDASALLDAELKRSGVKLRRITDGEGPCHVRVEPVQIEQVLVNLCRNAAEALTDEGVTEPWINIQVLRETDQVRVRVSDPGPALEAGIRENLFTPFFTTRREGLGLGLALSRSIIESHGGELRLLEDEDPGNIFEFTLPLAAPGGES